LAFVLSALITFPLWWIFLRYEEEKLSLMQRLLLHLCLWPVGVIALILAGYFTYKINVWWFDLYSFESWAKLCLSGGGLLISF